MLQLLMLEVATAWIKGYLEIRLPIDVSDPMIGVTQARAAAHNSTMIKEMTRPWASAHLIICTDNREIEEEHNDRSVQHGFPLFT